MPKQTFINLPPQKKALITAAFLREFATKSYDEASLSDVVKRLGIAKGSMYQYFEGKLDLFLHLVKECSIVKLNYSQTIARVNYPDFWHFLRALYEQGVEFDAAHPLESHFLFNLIENLNSPSIKHLHNEMIQQSVTGFEEMVKHEVELGLFRDDIPTTTMAFSLYKTGAGIQEFLIFSSIIDPKKSIENNTPVYLNKKKELMHTVDDFIRLAKPSFDKTF